MFVRHLSAFTAAFGVLLFMSGRWSSGNGSPAPTVASFTAGAATITTGGSTTLSWPVSNGATISIDQGMGMITGASVPVTPNATTTYTLTATGSTGLIATASATVTVVPAPTISSFTVSSGAVSVGNVTFSWTVSNGKTVSIDHGIGIVIGSSYALAALPTAPDAPV